jgi:hypothetical protein
MAQPSMPPLETVLLLAVPPASCSAPRAARPVGIPSSQIHRLCGRIFDWGKFFIERQQRRENGQQRFGWCGLNYKPLSILANNCVVSWQLKLARNSDRLIPPILE